MADRKARRGSSPIRHAFFACLALVGSLLFVFGAGELTLRWIFPPADFPNDRVLARRFFPHRQLRYTSKFGEFDVVSRYNSDGMHDIERTREKAFETRRIVVIGDSFTEAKQVAQHENYSALLELMLSQTTTTEVLNAGHSGFGSAEEFLVLKHFGIGREPDLVIQAFFLNDVYEDLRAVPEIEWDDGGLPLRIAGDGGSELWNFVKDLVRRLPFIWSTKVVDRDWLGDLERDPFAVVRANFQDADADWEITLRAIEASARLSDEHGAGYLLVLLPLALQVDPSYIDAVAQAYDLTTSGITDAPQKRLKAFADERGIEVLDLTPALQLRSEQQLFFHYDGHWTPAGHEVAAQAIADHLQAQGWPTPAL